MGDDVRYSDRPSTEREVFVAAEPARVWAAVCDVEELAKGSPELMRTEWLDGATGPALGARYVGHNEHPVAGKGRTLAHITEFEPERLLTWAVLDVDGRFGEPAEALERRMATWSFRLTPADGGTLLHQSTVIGPGPSGLTAVIARMPEKEEAVIAYRLREMGEGMDATLKAVKEAAEKAG
ncbi:SRPBCC family protein [Streptomyces sp. UH6]|uniref:SRPBCC family protein n=1 Tax=Streptomyces sp. UH6 TaxID=2748379 RepID=UPI001C55396D|nr:SRPBCC family protein [Streptomyces sp. UH6]